MNNTCIFVVSTTLPSFDEAKRVANELIRMRVVACAQLGQNINSVYIWQNKQYSETEVPITLKTSESALPKLEEALKKLHPYECPEFVAMRTTASEDYATWVNNICI